MPRLAFVLCVISLSGCVYLGVGEYEEHGVVLEWCHLELPVERVEEDRVYRYPIRGMGCRLNRSDHVFVTVESDYPIAPDALDLGVAVKVRGYLTTYFYQAGHLNDYVTPSFSSFYLPGGNYWQPSARGSSASHVKLTYGAPAGGFGQCRSWDCEVQLTVFNVSEKTQGLRVSVVMHSSWK